MRLFPNRPIIGQANLFEIAIGGPETGPTAVCNRRTLRAMVRDAMSWRVLCFHRFHKESNKKQAAFMLQHRSCVAIGSSVSRSRRNFHPQDVEHRGDSAAATHTKEKIPQPINDASLSGQSRKKCNTYVTHLE
jgi:hypothetical protein